MRLIVWQSILEDEDLMGEGDLMDETHFANSCFRHGASKSPRTTSPAPIQVAVPQDLSDPLKSIMKPAYSLVPRNSRTTRGQAAAALPQPTSHVVPTRENAPHQPFISTVGRANQCPA
jgi:hypothetical protein